MEPSNIEALANKAVVAAIVGRSDVVMDSIGRMQQIRLSARPEEIGWAFGEFTQGLYRIGKMYIAIGDSRNAYAIFEQLVMLRPEEKIFNEIFESLKQ